MPAQMKEYRVSWEIEVTASSIEDAAEQALEVQRDSSSDAVCFDVIDGETGESIFVDLEAGKL